MTQRHGSLTRKLVLATIAASGSALALGALLFVALEYRHGYAQAEHGLDVLTEIIAYNAAAPLEFREAEGARAVLESLRAEDSVLLAAIFEEDGTLLRAYRHPNKKSPPLPAWPLSDDTGPSRLSRVHPVELDGARLGWVYLHADLGALHKRLSSAVALTLLVLLICAALATLMGGRMLRGILAPVFELAEAARDVSQTQNYSLRVQPRDDDEIGDLVEAVNSMLERIEADTDLKRINAELREQTERAERAVRARSSFLANMSHEIRTPMTAILGFAELLDAPDLDPEQRREHLNTIRSSGQHLLTLLNDVLDLSKIEAGGMQLERVPVDPGAIAREAIDTLGVPARQKGLSLELELDSSLPVATLVDPTRLRQILINLLSNAIKFTEMGRVRCEIRCAHDTGWLEFEVSDTGIGMTADQLARIFRPFSQADGSMSRRFGGTGLGLSISQQLALLMGGEIQVRSEPGAGSQFTLRLPLERPDEDESVDTQVATSRTLASESITPAQLRGRILLAEDTPAIQRLVKHLLQGAGLEVDVADNGRRACEQALAARDSGHPHDVILMDMQMPEMSGYEATARLREQGLDVPVVALTAHAGAEAREECLRAGCDEYLTKPLDRRQLVELLRSLLEPR